MKFTGKFKDLKKLGYQFVCNGPACWFKRVIPGDYIIWIFKKGRRVVIDDAGEHSDAYANWVVGEYFGSCALVPRYHSNDSRKVALDIKTGLFEPYKPEKHSWPFVAIARNLEPDAPEGQEHRDRYRILTFNVAFQCMVQELFDLHLIELDKEAEVSQGDSHERVSA
jgi:hypothetical protein